MPFPLLEGVLEFFSARRVRVVGDSMLPAFAAGDRLVVSRRAYRDRAPARFDVVLLIGDAGQSREDLKRIIGLPGESVRLNSGELSVNGNIIDEPHVAMEYESTAGDYNWTPGEDEYVVLGDNRRASTDSRACGVMKRARIIGPVTRKS